MAAVAKVRKNGARPMNAKRETRIQTYFGKHRPKDRKGHQEAKTPRVNTNATLIYFNSNLFRAEWPDSTSICGQEEHLHVLHL